MIPNRLKPNIWLLLAMVWLVVSCNTADPGDTGLKVENDSEISAAEVLKIYNWGTYIDPQILTNFEQKYGVTIDYQIYDSDNDLLNELLDGAIGQYDLVVPSDFIVAEMRNEELLAPLNKSNIPNFQNVDQTFISPGYDPGNRYCAPYQWGTVGIGYNIKATGREITGWSDFFDPAFAGRVALMDDYRTTLGLILLWLGYSPNTTNRSQIAEAIDLLKSRSDQIGGFLGDDAQDRLLAGEYDLVVEWSGDIFQAMEEDPDIRYVIPAEGSIIWVDNVCIPAGAPNKELAETFINYILEPEVGAALSNFIQYGSPNQASLPFINEEDLNNPAIYPPETVRERLFLLVDIGVAADEMYQTGFEEIMSGWGS